MRVTVIRQVPPLVIGTCGVIPNHEFDTFEEHLDALESTGVTVERFEPTNAAAAIAARPVVQRLVATEGERSFPLVLVNDEIVTSGRYPSRTQWAHAIGAGRSDEKFTPAR